MSEFDTSTSASTVSKLSSLVSAGAERLSTFSAGVRVLLSEQSPPAFLPGDRVFYDEPTAVEAFESEGGEVAEVRPGAGPEWWYCVIPDVVAEARRQGDQFPTDYHGPVEMTEWWLPESHLTEEPDPKIAVPLAEERRTVDEVAGEAVEVACAQCGATNLLQVSVVAEASGHLDPLAPNRDILCPDCEGGG